MESVSFETQLGHMAVALDGTKLHALVFGYSSKRAALQALAERTAHLEKSAVLGGDWTDLIERLKALATGEPVDFTDVELADEGLTPFQLAVRKACRDIPWGETLTYGQLAEIVGRPGAARAVGTVMSSNCVPLVVPCHRVVPASGGLGGFSAPQGIKMKQRLLEAEQLPLAV